MKVDQFPKAVADKLDYYVYRLIDPRNGETFYVGKCKNNRIFDHLKSAAKPTQEFDEESDKLKVIRAILNEGLEVVHVIHRHGMDENTAMQVEAALIDAYIYSTNEAGGVGSDDFGPQNALQIINQYQALEADFKDNCLLINVNRSSEVTDLYSAVRYAWRIDAKRAEQADYVLAVTHGIIIGVFKADRWLEANKENFPDFPERIGRYGFIGKEVTGKKREQYIQKRLPEGYRAKGAANPIRYSYEMTK